LEPETTFGSKEELMQAKSLKYLVVTAFVLSLGTSAWAVSPKKQHHSRFSHLRHTAAWKHHGQQQIQQDRAREIQEALIREHYLDGQPTGVWDAKTTEAMRHFQSDQGWQSKVVPDSRALIKLGLGPNHENDLNPDLMGDGIGSPLKSQEADPAGIPQR
jgi:peptidoglycan hydrolase-like protein with peptidoglycan-binding domain